MPVKVRSFPARKGHVQRLEGKKARLSRNIPRGVNSTCKGPVAGRTKRGLCGWYGECGGQSGVRWAEETIQNPGHPRPNTHSPPVHTLSPSGGYERVRPGLLPLPMAQGHHGKASETQERKGERREKSRKSQMPQHQKEGIQDGRSPDFRARGRRVCVFLKSAGEGHWCAFTGGVCL